MWTPWGAGGVGRTSRRLYLAGVLLPAEEPMGALPSG